MTPEQYNEAKRIIDDAPDGATHYDCHSGGYARIVGDIQFERDFGKWQPTWPECQDVYVTRSLSDIKALVAMYERDMWIPVSERLPEKTGYYYVHCKSGLMQSTYFIEDRDSAKDYFSYSGSYSRKSQGKLSAHFAVAWTGHEITHWKPLPAPPEDKDNE